jgi:hypothetical protein
VSARPTSTATATADLLVGNNESSPPPRTGCYSTTATARSRTSLRRTCRSGSGSTDGIAVGDVDGDGDLDFVTGDSWQNRLS